MRAHVKGEHLKIAKTLKVQTKSVMIKVDLNHEHFERIFNDFGKRGT